MANQKNLETRTGSSGIVYEFNIDPLIEVNLRRGYNSFTSSEGKRKGLTPGFQRFSSYSALQEDIVSRIYKLFEHSLETIGKAGLDSLKKIKIGLDRSRNRTSLAWYNHRDSTQEEAIIGINYWRALRMPYEKPRGKESQEAVEEYAQIQLARDIIHELDHARDRPFIQYSDNLISSLKLEGIPKELLRNFEILSGIRIEGLATLKNVQKVPTYYLLGKGTKELDKLGRELRQRQLRDSKRIALENMEELSGDSRKRISPYISGRNMFEWFYLSELANQTSERDLGRLLVLGSKEKELCNAIIQRTKHEALVDPSIRTSFDRYFQIVKAFGLPSEHTLLPQDMVEETLKFEDGVQGSLIK